MPARTHREDVDGDQLLDGGEVLTCTFATMDLLQRAVAAELGEDDGEAYGLGRDLAPDPAPEAGPAADL